MSVYLVCGSRDWPAPWFVTAKIIELVPEGATILTGGAPGVDQHAHKEAIRLGYNRLSILADWEQYGKRAGFLRNLAMLDVGPDAVLAFHFQRSKGTAHTIREAYKRGVTVHRFTEDDLRRELARLEQQASDRARALICCHGGELTPECDPCLTRARLECAAVGHLTARGAHERAWGEPLPAGSQNPDLCLRCGETEEVEQP